MTASATATVNPPPRTVPPDRRLIRPRRAVMKPWDLLRLLIRQRFVEWRVRSRGDEFRSTDREQVERSYGAMTVEEFEAINAGQEWVNAHLVPWALQVMPDDRPWRVVDLGCGTGGSVALLVRHAPPGSSVIAYDLDAHLLARARNRLHPQNGVRIDFVRQSICEPLRRADGSRVPDRSVDLVHSAGVVGHHLDEETAGELGRELQRVVAGDGVAVLDAGPALPPQRLRARMREHGFEAVAQHRVLPLGRRAAMVFRREA